MTGQCWIVGGVPVKKERNIPTWTYGSRQILVKTYGPGVIESDQHPPKKFLKINRHHAKSWLMTLAGG